MTKKLTDKQQAFINEYLKCWNAAEAARRAGYSEKSARFIGAENLTKPYISDEIQRRMDELTMKSDEALIRLTKQARATFGDILKMAGNIPMLDWQKAIESGAIDNVKEIQFRDGSISVKLYDAQSALVQILRQRQLMEGKPTDRHEITVNDSRERLARLISDRVERGRSFSGTDLAQ